MVDVIEGLGRYRRKIYIVMPEHTVIQQAVYFHGSPGEGGELAEKLGGRMAGQLKDARAGLAILEVEDWNRDLSPWRAQGISAEAGDFAGSGREYLEDLCSEVIPGLEKKYGWGCSGFRRILGGYSMGGLFALFAVLENSFFQDMISVSGSLWYDGIMEYLSKDTQGEGQALSRERRAYFSLGKREPKSRNPRMAKVGKQTEAILEMLKVQGFSVYFEWNPGSHFQEALERMEQGISYMIKND